MPIQGFARNRFHQFGLQTVVNTPVDATRRIAFRGVPDINPNWTDQEVDTGSIDIAVPAVPRRGRHHRVPDRADELPPHPAAHGGGRAWWRLPVIVGHLVHVGAPVGVPDLDHAGLLHRGDGRRRDARPRRTRSSSTAASSNACTMGFDETLGPWTVAADWRFSGVNAHGTPTAGLTVGSNLPLVFGADTALYIDDTSGSIGGTLIADSLHSAEVRIENTIDLKRFAQGSNTRFQIGGYGLSARVIGATFRFAKTSQIVAALNCETVDWLNATAVNRYVQLVTTSTVRGRVRASRSPGTRVSAGTWRVRSDVEIGGNAVVELQLVGHYDASLGYAYRRASSTSWRPCRSVDVCGPQNLSRWTWGHASVRDTPHAEGDKAWLRPRLDTEAGSGRPDICEAATATRRDVRASWAWPSSRTGSCRGTSWTMPAARSPCNEDTLRSGALDWETTLSPIAERASVLYTDSVVNPLRKGRDSALASWADGGIDI